MELQLIRDNMETEQVISARPTQISVETEAALPGGLREEARVFYADAQVNVNGGELTGNRITADGKVNFHVLYAQGDLSKVAALEASADFSQALPLKEENTQQLSARVTPRAEVQHVSAKAFNGRLILRAILQLSAEAVVPRTVSFVRDAEENENVEKAMQEIRFQRTAGEGESQTLLKEEIELADVLQVRDTLYATAHAQVEDILGGSDGRAVVTGTIQLEACHTSDMPGRPLIYTRHSVPYEQAVNLSGALGESLAAQSRVLDVAVLTQDNGSGDKIMRAEVQLKTSVAAVEEKQMQALRDAFTLEGENIESSRRHVVFRTGTVNEQAAESGRTVMTLPEGSPRVKTPLLAFARPIPVKIEKKGEKLAVEGILEATLIYRTDDSDIPVSVEQEESFQTVFTTQAEPEDALAFSVLQMEPSAVTGDRVELKYILQLQAEGVRKAGADLIVDAVPAAAAAMEKGIALYFLQPGESLWDVAKHYRVPVEEILSMNPGLKEKTAPGEGIIAYRR